VTFNDNDDDDDNNNNNSPLSISAFSYIAWREKSTAIAKIINVTILMQMQNWDP
jgi:hypothetical protein